MTGRIILLWAALCWAALGQQRILGDFDLSANATLGAANNAVTIDVNALTETAAFYVTSGALVGTITFEGTVDNTNYISVLGVRSDIGSASLTVVNPGTSIAYTIAAGGYRKVRARVSAYTSGSTTGWLRVGAGPPFVFSQRETATTLADAVSNAPHVTTDALIVNALYSPVFPYVFNGTTWDRSRGDTTNGMWVNVKTSSALPANQSVNVSQINAVTPLMGNGVTGTGSSRVTIASDNTAFAVNNTQQGTASQNVAQLAGTTTDTNSGSKSAGTLRVVLATDQPALTNKLLVTPDSVALPANQSVNTAQINAVTPLMGNGVTGTGSQRVTIASDNTAFSVNESASSATGSAVPAKAGYMGGNSSGNLVGIIACDNFQPISVTAAATTIIIALASSKVTYICAVNLFAAGTTNAALVYGTGTTCGTGTTGLFGGTTSGTGYNLLAQTGISMGSGLGMLAKTASAKDVCLINSGTTQLSGSITYTQF